MTVEELIEELKKFPPELVVDTYQQRNCEKKYKPIESVYKVGSQDVVIF